MCLLTVAIDQSRRFPLVVAGNRDEFFNRPAARLAWWSPGDGLPDVLGGATSRPAAPGSASRPRAASRW